MESNISNYWAKDDGESLISHSMRVAEIAKTICNMLPIPHDERNKFKMTVSEIGLLHDIGKAAVGFQKMVQNNWLRCQVET